MSANEEERAKLRSLSSAGRGARRTIAREEREFTGGGEAKEVKGNRKKSCGERERERWGRNGERGRKFPDN